MAIDPTTLFPGAAGDREGAILKIRPENLWQDTARTTAVTTDGDPVRAIDDISVNGRDFVILNTSVPMTYHTDGTAHWLTATGAANSGLISVVEWTFMSGNPYSVGAAVSFDTPTAGDQYIFCTGPTSGGNANNSIVHVGARSGSQVTVGHWFNDANFSHTTAATTAKRHICEYKSPGSEYTIDGTSIGSNGSTPSSLDEVGEARVFSQPVNSKYTDGNIYGMIIVIDTITAQEKADIDEWLQEQIEGPSEQTIVVGQAAETDAATSMVMAVTIVTGQSTETSTANAVTGAKALAVGQSTETPVATSVAGSKTHTSGQAAEADTATAVGGAKIRTTGLSSESSTANATVATRTELALQAAEEDNATAVTITRAWAVGQATEVNEATQIAAAGALNIGLASETAASQPVGHFRVATLGLSTVTDAAQPVGHSRATLVGQASETNAASSLGHSRLAAVGLANEANTAGDVTATGGAEPEPGEGGFWVIRRRRRWV